MSDSGSDTIVGIDLGTTFSCVAVFRNHNVEVIPNDQGNRVTPSVVSFVPGEGRPLVGDAAVNAMVRHPCNSIYDAKRVIGRKFDEKVVADDVVRWPFKCVADGERNEPVFELTEEHTKRRWAPEEISATILAYLKNCAEMFVGHTLTKAVVTVPAYFNDAQRQRTKAAGEIAGLDVLRIINEPTAAALAYGIGTGTAGGVSDPENVFVFDLGGGTFDVSIITLDCGAFEVRATAGDSHLGGEDFDNAIVDHVYEILKTKHSKDPSTLSAKVRRRIKTTAEKVKKNLSSQTSSSLDIEGILDGDDLSLDLSRSMFEKLSGKLLTKCMNTVKAVLKDAKLTKDDIHQVVMVGGSSRIPKVQALLKDFFGHSKINFSVNPDEVVAYGAAIQASILSSCAHQKSDKTSGLILMDVTPLSIGIDVDDGFMDIVVKRNTTIPYKETREYSTVEDHQTAVEIEVYEGERPKVKNNHFLGSFKMDGVTKGKRGVPTILATFSIDADGVLTVTADEMTKAGQKKQSAGLTVRNANALTPDQISKMVEDAKASAADDQHVRALGNGLHNFRRVLLDAEDAVRGIETQGLSILRAKHKDFVEKSVPLVRKAAAWYDEARAAPSSAAEQLARSCDKNLPKLESLASKLKRIQKKAAKQAAKQRRRKRARDDEDDDYDEDDGSDGEDDDGDSGSQDDGDNSSGDD